METADMEKTTNETAGVSGTGPLPHLRGRAGERAIPKHQYAILTLIVVAALFIRVLAVLTRPLVMLDETAYVRMAENLAAGQGLLDITGLTATHFSPLLPLLSVAGSVFTGGDYITASYALVAVFGSLLLLPAWWLARDIAGPRVALMTAALLAVMPLMVDYSSRVYSESVYVFFLLSALAAGWRLLAGGGWTWGALAGLSLGLAYLANPSAVFYFASLVILTLAVAAKKKRWRRLLPALALFTVLFVVMALPYLLFLHDELGRWTYSGKAAGNIQAAAAGLTHGTPEWEREMLSLTDDGQLRILAIEDQSDPLRALIAQPVQGLKIFLRQSWLFCSRELQRTFPLWLLPLVGLGLFTAWDRRRAAANGYLLLMMAPALLIFTMYAHNRFFIPFVPLVIIWAALGWERLERWGRESAALSLAGAWRRRAERWTPLLLAMAVLLPTAGLAAATVMKQGYDLRYRQAGEWLRQNAGPGQRIMGREYTTALYAGGTAVMLPWADYERITEYARANGVDYMVLDGGSLSTWRPELSVLLEEEASHPEWQQAGVAEGDGVGEYLIFKLRK